MFIKNIFVNKIDDGVHQQFIRFGKGNYATKAVVNAKISGNNAKASGTFELANDFVLLCSDLAPKLKISGIILSKEKMNLENERKKSGIFEYSIDKEIDSKELKNIVEKCYFALIDCQAPGISFKVKKKLPRPGKSGDTKVNDKFCALELDMKFFPKLKDGFFWDAPVFKKARAEHSYLISEIIIPKELEKEKNFDKIRQEAKRKGVLTRKVIADGKETVKEINFAV